jgi:hypothetical protein
VPGIVWCGLIGKQWKYLLLYVASLLPSHYVHPENKKASERDEIIAKSSDAEKRDLLLLNCGISMSSRRLTTDHGENYGN